MLQEIYDNKKSTPKGDLILVIGLFVLFVFARYIASALRSLPLGGVWQLLVFFALLAGVYYLYKTCLVSYRYTLTFEEIDAEKSEIMGSTVRNPYPLGSFIVENVSGSKGKLLEAVMPQEYLELLPPQQDGPYGDEKIHTLHLTTQSKKSAYSLYFRRDNVLYRLLFSPSEEMSMRLDTLIKELKQA